MELKRNQNQAKILAGGMCRLRMVAVLFAALSWTGCGNAADQGLDEISRDFASLSPDQCDDTADEGVDGCEQDDVVTFDKVTVLYEPLQGIGPEKGMMRRDPSDIIRVGGLYYVWYTKVLEGAIHYPEGNSGTIWYAVSEDGIKWTEQGEALAAC